jgi:acetylornithine deacetylase/succinyl-diaminopimelate desuccinylase-like protein
VKLAEVIRRLAAYKPPAVMHDVWLRFVDALGLPAAQRLALRTGPGLELALSRLPLGTARMLHGITHTTLSPNIAQGGVKTNIIPDRAEVQIDIRTLPGVDRDAVHGMLKDAIGDLWSAVEIAEEGDNLATVSAMDSDLSRAIDRVTARLVPGATTVPQLLFGATDARFFRRKGVTAYGYGLFSEKLPLNEVATMFHGRDERIDQESLRLMVDLWNGVARDLLS